MASLSDVFYPTEEERSRLCATIADLAANGGAATNKTITLGNDNPPIDQRLPNPVIAIIAIQDGSTFVANGCQGWDISGQADATPASSGEFQITGNRTIDVYQEANESMKVLVLYVGRGGGQKR